MVTVSILFLSLCYYHHCKTRESTWLRPNRQLNYSKWYTFAVVPQWLSTIFSGEPPKKRDFDGPKTDDSSALVMTCDDWQCEGKRSAGRGGDQQNHETNARVFGSSAVSCPFFRDGWIVADFMLILRDQKLWFIPYFEGMNMRKSQLFWWSPGFWPTARCQETFFEQKQSDFSAIAQRQLCCRVAAAQGWLPGLCRNWRHLSTGVSGFLGAGHPGISRISNWLHPSNIAFLVLRKACHPQSHWKYPVVYTPLTTINSCGGIITYNIYIESITIINSY